MYELWTLTRSNRPADVKHQAKRPTADSTAPTPAPASGFEQFDAECTAINYLTVGLAKLFKLTPGRKAFGDLQSFPLDQWAVALCWAHLQKEVQHADVISLVEVGEWCCSCNILHDNHLLLTS